MRDSRQDQEILISVTVWFFSCKNLQRASTDKEDALYYEVPPAPRPYPARYSPVRYIPMANNTNSLTRRPPQPAPKPEDDTYYITCPPSGLPIHCK